MGFATSVRQFAQQVELDLLHLHQLGGVLMKKVVHFFVQMTDLELGLQIDLIVALRVLAVASAKPSRYLPDIQTFQDMDYKDILFQDWLGVFAPAGTSPEAVRQMNLAMADAARSEQGQAALTNLGFTPEIVTPEVFAELVRADYRRYGVLVERTRFRETFEKSSGQ